MTLSIALSKLTDRERRLIELREGQKLTWAKIGEDLGVGGQYAAQLYKAAVKRLEKLQASEEQPEFTEGDQAVMRKWEEIESLPKVNPAPKTVIATGQPQPRVVVVTGVPMVLPTKPIVEKHWSSVTIRS